MSDYLDARLLPASVAIGRLSWCCSTGIIGDLRLISDEIVARLAYERALFQPRISRARTVSLAPGTLPCLLLVILPAAMTAADLCMGRDHCAEEEQQRHHQPAPRCSKIIDPCSNGAGSGGAPDTLNSLVHPPPSVAKGPAQGK